MRTIAHLSDLHFGRHNERVAEALLQDLWEIRPSLIAISGDLTQRARKREFQAACDFLKQAPTPHLSVPGNHDIPLENVFERFLSPFGRYQKYISEETAPTFVDPEFTVFGLNTAHPSRWKQGYLSHEQRRSLEERLRAAPARNFRILLCHHPVLVPPELSDLAGLTNPGSLLPILETGALDLILAGHLHRNFLTETISMDVGVKHSTLLVQAGTAISTRERGEANAYTLITLNPGEILMTVRVWDDRQFHTSIVITYRKAGNNWVHASTSPPKRPAAP
ncbi:MAG: metallophosphoesterase [Candidatus Manganitrophus sp. SA1]|nr:metallophosphoesterase [Candidatus Manganitrophus morganii]